MLPPYVSAAYDFAEAYAKRSGFDLAWLLGRRKVVPCECGADGCEGWAMVPVTEHDYDLGYFRPSERTALA